MRKVIRILALVYLFIKNFCEKYGKRNRVSNHPSIQMDPLPKYFQCMGDRYLVTTGTSAENDLLKCIGGRVVCLSDENIKSAMTYFFRKATQEIKHFLKPRVYSSISTEIEGILYYSNRILPSKELRGTTQLSDVMLDLSSTTFCVPLTDQFSPIAYAIVNEVHMHHNDVKHGGIETILRYSQMISNIIGGRDLVKKYEKNCKKCKILKKKA